ncbi:hypothetical protein I6B53_08785 [Schaalia sp. 19OD2882]|uniref:hypothetical protein n=1 Tax=Schaalia sp. 19OD2882 TaxID=2794089 RepID=UPI001C1F0124|nr:hypothetical protein [Schaalia sp. 19OD2882]QWW19191.1 hypothetical protein I6B53_08785 [Schaalia sp. 19OD2882]
MTAVLVLSGLALFGAAAWVLGGVGLKGWKGTLPFGSRAGLRDRRVRACPEAWAVGHRAAAPILLLGAAVALVHLAGVLLTGVGALIGVADGTTVLHPLLGSGAVVVVALWLVAGAAGGSAADRVAHEEES